MAYTMPAHRGKNLYAVTSLKLCQEALRLGMDHLTAHAKKTNVAVKQSTQKYFEVAGEDFAFDLYTPKHYLKEAKL